jgi:hypothetical protein
MPCAQNYMYNVAKPLNNLRLGRFFASLINLSPGWFAMFPEHIPRPIFALPRPCTRRNLGFLT